MYTSRQSRVQSLSKVNLRFIKLFSCLKHVFPVVIIVLLWIKARFPLQPYRSETWRISLFREHSGRTTDMDTIEYATFRYDTVEVENGLKI